MDFISMDLIGTFETTTRGNQYVLTMIWMLTYYVICVTLTDKSANTIASAYLKEVYCLLGESRKILSDNGRKFKNTLFMEAATQLGQANGWIEKSWVS